MSNPIRVSVKAKLKFTVKHKDEVELKLGNDPIFSDERAEQIIESVLQAHGWQKEEKEGKTVYVKTDEDTEKTWDVKENKLTIKTRKEEVVEKEGQKTAKGDAWRLGRNAKKKLEEKARKQLEKDLKEEAGKDRKKIEEKGSKEVSESLECEISETLEETRDIITDIYKDWIKERAQSLGNVISETSSVSEDGNIFEMTIEIEE